VYTLILQILLWLRGVRAAVKLPAVRVKHAYNLLISLSFTYTSLWWQPYTSIVTYNTQLSIISGTGAALGTAAVVARCNGDDSTSIPCESVYKMSCNWLYVLIFYTLLFEAVHLTWCYFAMDLTKEQQLWIEFCANVGKSATETLTMIR
jgi:hypothetical protein